MAVRTTEPTVTFMRLFPSTPFAGPQPAGTCRLVTDEAEISGLSVLAFQPAATMPHIPAVSISGRRDQLVLVDPADFTAASAADLRA